MFSRLWADYTETGLLLLCLGIVVAALLFLAQLFPTRPRKRGESKESLYEEDHE